MRTEFLKLKIHLCKTFPIERIVSFAVRLISISINVDGFKSRFALPSIFFQFVEPEKDKKQLLNRRLIWWKWT